MTNGKIDELKAGLASVGIGWIEPQDRRNKAGLFMLNHGVKMGVAVDPADVQDMLVEFCDIYVRELEMRADAYKKLAEDALANRPTPPIFLNVAIGRCDAFGHKLYAHPQNNFCENWKLEK